jgi:hypothetical protein
MPFKSYLLTAIICVLLAGATVIGILTTADDSQRPSVGSQDRSGLVLYGGR